MQFHRNWSTLLLLLLTNLGWSQDKKLPDPKEVLRALDYLYRADSSQAEMTMTIETPEWTRSLSMQVWSKGLDHTLIRILSPKKDRGISTLKQGDQMWNFFPKIDRVMRIPPSMMMGSWMGSDLTNDDLVRDSSYEEDYTYTIKKVDDKLVLVLTPREATVSVWGRIEMRMKVEKPWLPLEQSFFNERDEAVRRITFSDVKDFEGRKIPSKMEVHSLTKKGHKTSIEYQSLKFDIKLEEDIFSLRNLQQGI
ncbi:MAG: outer membrane lipoprotein-sorting protein [Oligoflexus sp.]